MPELFPALARHTAPTPARNTAPACLPSQGLPGPPTPKGGRLREAFENRLVLEYLDLAEALAARFEARGRERADLNQVAYLGLVKAAKGFDQSKGDSFPAYAAEVLACADMPLEQLEELSCLRDAMQGLDAGDRELLYRRYFCEETQVQLGKQLGMTQMQVSRRLARVLVGLQQRLLDSSRCSPAADLR